MFREIGREIATQGLKLSRPDTQSCVAHLETVGDFAHQERRMTSYGWANQTRLPDPSPRFYLQ